MVILKKQHLNEMLYHSSQGLPNESCGLLGGIIEGDKKIIQKVYLLNNIDNSPEHFSMDIQEQFKAITDMRKNRWQLLGNFHSHPSSPARPSAEDIRLAFDPCISYLILSLEQNSNPVLKSFIIKDKNVSLEELIVLE
ncbi:MAG: Mov34/MPN/PAD family protein [Eubacterium sp.]|jgi:proteasome lid subunit RPN8/RPN11|nr:Mov34/MPN/PAD family protein [Eubacterium sp.]